jgi:hypothetical protein
VMAEVWLCTGKMTSLPLAWRTSSLVVKSWMTAHPELILGSLGEFETCPDWVPGMDTARPFASMMIKTESVHGLDHTANWLAKVRNVSSVGSHSKLVFEICTLRATPI